MHYPNDKSSPRYPNLINEWSPLTVNKNIHLFKHLSDKREFKKKRYRNYFLYVCIRCAIFRVLCVFFFCVGFFYFNKDLDKSNTPI